MRFIDLQLNNKEHREREPYKAVTYIGQLRCGTADVKDLPQRIKKVG